MLLEGISSDKPLADGWDDKQYILQRGLDKVRDAAGLEQKFHVFIERSLNFIGKECFLMAFDDVDTDFSRGWPVLEVIRRYLTSPRWITVVCGDLDLFAILVLGKQWSNFEKKILKYDQKNILSLRNMVAHLQSQYLLKVLRPDNRITLLPLSALTDQVTVGRGPNNLQTPKKALREYVNTLVHEGLNFRVGWECRLVGELLLRQPVRTVLQVLSLGPEDWSQPDAENNTSSASREIPATFPKEELLSIFIDALLRYNLSPDELREAGSTRLLPRLAQFLTENEAWLHAYTLFPDHQDDNLNLALLGLGAWVHKELDRLPHLALEYIVRICLSHQVLDAGLDGPSAPRNHREFADFAELMRLTATTGVAGRIVSAIAGAAQNIRPRFGIIPLYRSRAADPPKLVQRMYGLSIKSPAFPATESTNSQIKSFHDGVRRALGNNTPGAYTGIWFNSVDSLASRLDPTSSALVLLAVSQVVRGNSEYSMYFSLYRLIAVIARIMEGRFSTENPTHADVAYTLRSKSRRLAYVVPPWARPPTAEPQTEANIEADALLDRDEAQDTLASAPIVDRLLKWSLSTPNRSPPPYVLARAWNRFHQALTSIDEEIRHDQWFLGYLFHRHIIAFLNSLLVEEALQLNTIEIPTRNPVSDDRIFLRNLSEARQRHAAHPFFDLIWACPLWCAYLKSRRRGF